jgi:hypothetical protein
LDFAPIPLARSTYPFGQMRVSLPQGAALAPIAS